MAGKRTEIILNDVRALIKKLTDFEENHENFKACERFVLSNLLHHRYMSVDGHAVRRSVEGMVTKFHVHGLLDRAQELENLVQKFLTSFDFKDHGTVDIQWCLLSLLLHLGQNPTNILGHRENDSDPAITIAVDEDHDFDWASYLREGDEEFHHDWNDDNSSNEEDETDHLAVISSELELHQSPVTVKSTAATSTVLQQSSQVGIDFQTPSNTKRPNFLNAQNILSAECWLQNNVQHDWWSKAYSKHKSLSNNPFSQTAHLWDPAQKEGIKTSTFSEHKTVLEVIWLLSAPCDSAIFMRVISDDGMKTHFCVRPHVTVPSVLQDIFSSFMSSICLYADMIEDLQNFCSKLRDSCKETKVCGTYEAYRCALLQELQKFYETLSLLEQRAHRQGETLTLLVLSQELSPSLSMVESLHKLHTSAVLDWKHTPNWLCATHLLSAILSSLQIAEEHIGCKLRIFVRTFLVYISIIDQWLTRGQLLDYRDEFFIARTDNKSGSLGASFEKRDWEKEMAARGVESPHALQVLANCLLKASQPLHILYELKKLPELRKHTSTRCKLEHLFFQNLISNLETSQLCLAKEENMKAEIDAWWKKLDCDPISKAKSNKDSVASLKEIHSNRPTDVESVMTYLHRLDEPLLVKDFQALLSHSDQAQTSDSLQEMNGTSLLDRVMFLSQSMLEHLPLGSHVERAVLRLSADWEGIAGALVGDILIREHQLLFHLQSAQSVFMLQASHKLQPFLSHLFKLVLHRADFQFLNSHSLSVLLQDCMDSDHFTVSVIVTNIDLTEMSALECIDSLHFKYQVKWPLCAILGEKSESVYNVILCLLLKLRWGLWILEKLDVADFRYPDDSHFTQRLLYLRFWLLHVMRGSYSFLAGHILNTLCLKFEKDITSSKDMHSIIQVHDRFLDFAVHKCLHADKSDAIKTALFQLVVLAENLHSLWAGSSTTESLSKLRKIEACYSECHLFLAAALHSLAEEEGLQHLVFLSDLFNWNIPQRKDGSS